MGAAAPVLDMRRAEFTEIVCGALEAAVANTRNPAKSLARIANTNVRTAENWLSRKCTPRGLTLLQLIAKVPELQAEVRRLTAMEADLDPMLEQQLSHTFRLFQQMSWRRQNAAIQAAQREQEEA